MSTTTAMTSAIQTAGQEITSLEAALYRVSERRVTLAQIERAIETMEACAGVKAEGSNAEQRKCNAVLNLARDENYQKMITRRDEAKQSLNDAEAEVEGKRAWVKLALLMVQAEMKGGD